MAARDSPPPEATAVTVKTPEEDPVQDIVEVADVPNVTLVGLNEQDRLVVTGDMEEVRLTVPVNPFRLDTVTVAVPAVLAWVLTLDGATETEKLDTLAVNETEWDRNS